MKFFPRGLTIGVLLLVLFTSGCNLPAAQSPTAVGTILPIGPTSTTIAPTLPVSTGTPMTIIPVTGSQDVLLQCQFCVNDEPHAVLILPQSAAFLVAEPVIGVNCITAQVVNDRRILFCRGAQQTVFTLNVCFDGASCLQYPITLATCPLGKQAARFSATPVVLIPCQPGDHAHRTGCDRGKRFAADTGSDNGCIASGDCDNRSASCNRHAAAPGGPDKYCSSSPPDTNSSACHRHDRPAPGWDGDRPSPAIPGSCHPSSPHGAEHAGRDSCAGTSPPSGTSATTRTSGIIT